MSINKVVMVGNMTRDPELRRTANGNPVASFTLALNRIQQSSDGQQADYISCVVWGKIAENTAQYCSKGSKVGVVGHLQSRSYDNAQGQRVYVTEVVCEQVDFINTRNQENNAQPQQVENNPFDQSFNIMDEDLPF
jgi:single-strand DNA-binding protein|nr:MAG TPA: Single strand binding protein [Caudoviricetes sp.]